MHDKVRADRCCRPALLVFMPMQARGDLDKPAVELFRATAIHRRKRADHAVAAGSGYEFHAGNQEHGSCDQRQPKAILKPRERVGTCLGTWQGRFAVPVVMLALPASLARSNGRHKRQLLTSVIPGRCVSGSDLTFESRKGDDGISCQIRSTKARTHKGGDAGFWRLSSTLLLDQSIASFDPSRRNQRCSVCERLDDRGIRVTRFIRFAGNSRPFAQARSNFPTENSNRTSKLPSFTCHGKSS